MSPHFFSRLESFWKNGGKFEGKLFPRKRLNGTHIDAFRQTIEGTQRITFPASVCVRSKSIFHFFASSFPNCYDIIPHWHWFSVNAHQTDGKWIGNIYGPLSRFTFVEDCDDDDVCEGPFFKCTGMVLRTRTGQYLQLGHREICHSNWFCFGQIFRPTAKVGSGK